ncbi:Dot/Icm T4SS effector Wip [Legionella bononiensis]|uniref:Type IV secretion protein Dot n=1 Tax=Legionella bononiensis TaxID=2793102 RepID=A0ABS1WD93_9GAMM|nr:Dot/Icm T4SS effector Wip [Legionella bononiensis]MBL7481226.1 type IV secretion protein Dot [Legionella bononiensis]MBL7527333.1 type IV secretion protein Dot [Legionella bononiensis]
MSHQLISEQVDIYQFPDVCYPAKENTQITIGDLHGNSMKLMFMLVKQGITTNVTKEQYDKLTALYNKNVVDLTKQDIEEFNKIIAGITFNKTAITLIGDELADRGSNDYFTLKILEKLKEQQVPVKIIISNHSIEFLQACEKYETTKHFRPPMLMDGHADSLVNLNTLVEKGIVSAEEVLKLAQNAYKPNIKAISYSLNEDSSEITLYSHSGIGLNILRGLADQFNVPYKDSSAVELAKTIDKINQKFQEHVQQGTVHTLCPPDAMYAGYTGYTDLTKTPLVCAMWNRLYKIMERPANHKGYRLVYVHGHDPKDPDQDQEHVRNLDANNNLGKLIYMNQGTYEVLCTDIYSKDLAEQIENNDKQHDFVEQVELVLPKTEQVDAGQFDAQQSHVDQNELLKPTTISLDQLKQSFDEQLEQIKKKEKVLRQDGYTDAADAAKKLHQKITDSFNKTLPNNAEQFKKECKDAIDEALPQLENHRGWKLALNYLMLTATGIGVLVVLADMGHKLVTGKHLSFFKTDTAQKVSDLEKMVDEVPESPKLQ